MNTANPNTWQAKLAAWTHDPAEKALVLLRDPAGHEGGTVRALRDMLFPQGLPPGIANAIKRADHWASAADRPQFPRSASDGTYAGWTQVRFDLNPVLIHPLSGEQYDLGRLDVEVDDIKSASKDHFAALIHRNDDGTVDARRTALAFWRFGPEPPDTGNLGALWQLLPADTRIPDHTIWAHLDLSAAFATAMAADPQGEVALLSMSFGPVQEFIAQARTTSDLWAGSHLLSYIVWQGLKVLCEEVGPDAIVFPQLRGVPLVDLWLSDEVGLKDSLFSDETGTKKPPRTDSDPLFSAALPNKFVALVPAARAGEFAEQIAKGVRDFVQGLATGMLSRLLVEAGVENTPDLYCHQQLREQLTGFPEVHWAAVPYGALVREVDGDVPDVSQLVIATTATRGTIGDSFLGSEAWRRLQRPLDVEGVRFYRPNPGVLYPAVYELLDNVAARAKSLREMPQRKPGGEAGYRCDLTGEAEWLTHDAALLLIPKGQRPDSTLWNRAGESWSALGRKQEHLCATAMLKRLWPSWFVQDILGSDLLRRYVVSTHTLALSPWIERFLDDSSRQPDDRTITDLERLCDDWGAERTALPQRLVVKIREKAATGRIGKLLTRLPDLLDKTRFGADGEDRSTGALRRLMGDSKPEAYYGLLLLDGDRMGAWISGSEQRFQTTTRDTFHPQIRAALSQKFAQPELKAYLDAPRAVSPARHMAISAALNNFSLHLAREVVEEQCKGKLIYAGGDDVLALVAIDDLLRCMGLLRAAYSGLEVPETLASRNDPAARHLNLRRGHAVHRGRVLRLMGGKATASLGAVIAHHTAPLGAVLRSLREAEATAKRNGRDRFTLSVLKRSGGRTDLTLPWRGEDQTSFGPIMVLMDLCRSFGADTSRNAAYRTLAWVDHLPHLPPAELVELLASQLGAQFERQARTDGTAPHERARKLARLVVGEGGPHDEIVKRLKALLVTAEFLAREGRAGEAPSHD